MAMPNPIDRSDACFILIKVYPNGVMRVATLIRPSVDLKLGQAHFNYRVFGEIPIVLNLFLVEYFVIYGLSDKVFLSHFALSAHQA